MHHHTRPSYDVLIEQILHSLRKHRTISECRRCVLDGFPIDFLPFRIRNFDEDGAGWAVTTQRLLSPSLPNIDCTAFAPDPPNIAAVFETKANIAGILLLGRLGIHGDFAGSLQRPGCGTVVAVI
jgi:hypothetical protein